MPHSSSSSYPIPRPRHAVGRGVGGLPSTTNSASEQLSVIYSSRLFYLSQNKYSHQKGVKLYFRGEEKGGVKIFFFKVT